MKRTCLALGTHCVLLAALTALGCSSSTSTDELPSDTLPGSEDGVSQTETDAVAADIGLGPETEADTQAEQDTSTGDDDAATGDDDASTSEDDATTTEDDTTDEGDAAQGEADTNEEEDTTSEDDAEQGEADTNEEADSAEQGDTEEDIETPGPEESCIDIDECGASEVCSPTKKTCVPAECSEALSCENGALCLSQDLFTSSQACYPSCEPLANDCGEGATCFQRSYSWTTGICYHDGPAGPGEPCTLSSISSGCVAGYQCLALETNGEVGVCRARCDIYDYVPGTCQDDEVCIPNGGVCAPLAGYLNFDSAMIGEPCTSQLSARCHVEGGKVGGLCKDSVCTQLCRVGLSDCDASLECVGPIAGFDETGFCVPPCVPDCTSKSCGDDGCGGSCGACADGTACDPTFACVTAPQGCDRLGFEVATVDLQQTASSVVYSAYTSNETSPDLLRIEIFQGPLFGGATAPGEYSLEGLNYANCGNCVLAYTQCTPDLSCERVYFVEDGVLEITTIGDEGFSGVLKDVRLIEVDIASDFTSTPVVDAEVWCLDNHAF